MTGLHAEGLSFRWHKKAPRALEDVSLEVPTGRLTVVVGPNGSGKSTLLKLLSGLRQPEQGRVTLHGIGPSVGGPVDLSRVESTARARAVAVVPQGLPPIPGVRVERFVSHGLYAQGGGSLGGGGRAALSRVEAGLARTEADHLAGRWMEELSGGERQRVLLARALVQDAPLLLCDEPTAALDLDHQAQVFALLRNLAREAPECRGVLVITHDLNLAAQCADILVVLDRGRLVASGPPGEILREDVLAPVFGGRLRYGEHGAGGPRWVLPRV